MNRLVLVGNLTKDPELRISKNGKPMTIFDVACQRRYKDADGNYPTDFVTCMAWSGTAEFVCKYFAKGQKIALEGSVQTHVKVDRGEKRKEMLVYVDNVEFASGRSNGNTRKSGDSVPPPTDLDEPEAVDYNGELPW